MLKVSTEIDSIEKLEKHIKLVETLSQLGSSTTWQDFIKDKCLNTVKEYAKTRLNGTSNEEYYQEYIDSIHIREGEIENGFEIVSDLTIEKPASRHSDGYTFSLSLAFEYGTGIVGRGSTDAPSNYRYNVNSDINYVKIDDEYVLGWWISASKAGNTITFGQSKSGKAVVTRGYEGLEIFRFAGAEIRTNLDKWVKDYLKKYGGVN